MTPASLATRATVRRTRSRLDRHARTIEIAASVGLVIFFGAAVWGGSQYPRTTPPTRTPGNLIVNEGFESGTAGWRPYGGNALFPTTDHRKAGQAAVVAVASVMPPVPYGAFAVIVLSPRAGGRYTFSVWTKGDKTTIGKTVRVSLTESGGGSPDRLMGATTAALTGGWRRLGVRGRVARADRVGISVYVVVNNDIAVGDTIYVDDARLRRLEVLDTTADGSDRVRGKRFLQGAPDRTHRRRGGTRISLASSM